MTEKIDVAVIGGGPAGAAAAIELAQRGARTVLLDRFSSVTYKPGEVLSSDIHLILDALGLRDCLRKASAIEVSEFQSAWTEGGPFSRPCLLDAQGPPVIVDRTAFETCLLEAARECGVSVVLGVGRSVAVAQSPIRNRADLELRCWSGGGQGEPGRIKAFRCGSIIEAHGRAGRVMLPNDRQRLDRLVGIMMYYDADGAKDRAPVVKIEPVESGWLFGSPVTAQRCLLAYYTDADLLPAVNRNWPLLLQDICSRSTMFTDLADRWFRKPACKVRDCSSSIRKQISNYQNCIALGDTAATYDPLYGGGVATAMFKGRSMAQLLCSGLRHQLAHKYYVAAENAAFHDYNNSRSKVYRRVMRFSDDTFWKRRHSPTKIVRSSLKQ